MSMHQQGWTSYTWCKSARKGARCKVTNKFLVSNDGLHRTVTLEDMGKPIGVADYQLIIPKEELRKAISDEIAVFESEQQKNM